MKELSLLMFLFGCGWVFAKLINRFTATPARKFYFSIPSIATYNILWGFIFYLGFAALMLPKVYKIWPLLTILVLLGFIFYYRRLYYNLQKTPSRFFKKIIRRQLQNQQLNDTLLNIPYSRKETLHILGLPSGIDENNPQIMKRLELLQQTAVQNPDFSYLQPLLSKLRSSLKNG